MAQGHPQKVATTLNILVLNCGSSSLKFQILSVTEADLQNNNEKVLASGAYERIGTQSLVSMQIEGRGRIKRSLPLRDHKSAIRDLMETIFTDHGPDWPIRSVDDIHRVGHRVVHGGEKLTRSVAIEPKIVSAIEDCIELAPLHNPANLEGIRAITQVFGPDKPQVAVFDTAFHATMPETAYVYGIPYQYYRRYKIRRYGFHGTSHRYLAWRYRLLNNLPKDQVKILTIHLGNGCSVCAIDSGTSQDTSMGMTPMEGLLMGTRAGDIDPAILEYLMQKEGIGLQDLDRILNKHSGLLGLSGLTHDMRELTEEMLEFDDRRARLAIDVFCRRVKKYIGSYLALLNGVDAIVFAGGIGENSAMIRQRICEDMSFVGVKLDEKLNQDYQKGEEAVISTDSSPVSIWVIPTNEELLIARDTLRCKVN